MNLFNLLFRRRFSCHQVDAVLQQYLDDELDPAQVPKVLAHLEMCRKCGLEAELYERIRASLHEHRHSPSPTSLDKIRYLARQLAVSGPPEGPDTPA